jgi:hypothetical protein
MTILTVTDTSDDPADPGSLAYALAIARNGDTIAFAPVLSGETITLDQVLDITTNVLIEGHTGGGGGTPDITLSGNGATPIFNVAAGVLAQFDGLDIVNGLAVGASGTPGNSPPLGVGGQGGDGQGAGGAIYNAGLAIVTNSYFGGNTAIGGAGGMGGDGFLAGGGGGGAGGNAAGAVFNAAGAATFWDGATVTFTGNYARGGHGGAGGKGVSTTGYTPGGGGGAPGYAGYAGGGPTNGGAGGQPGYPGSPGQLDLDLQPGGGGGGGGKDLGAIGGGLVVQSGAHVDLVTNTSDDPAVAGSLPYEIAIATAGDRIAFDPSLAGATITLGTTLVIDKSIEITGHIGGGYGAPDIAISGNDTTRLLQVQPGIDVWLDGLTLEHGGDVGTTGTPATNYVAHAGAGGVGVGGIANLGNLIVTNSSFIDNAAIGGTGGAGVFTLGGGTGGGAGGYAAGAIYDFVGSRLFLGAGTVGFSGNQAVGGFGGAGGAGLYEPIHGTNFPLPGGYAGPPGMAGTDGNTVGYAPVAAGGKPGQPGAHGDVFGLLNGTVITSGGGGGGGYATDNIGGIGTVSYFAVTCFAEGTPVATPFGQRRVEHLGPGDAVLTVAGRARSVRWIGRRRLRCADHPRPDMIWPVRILADAVAPGRPVRDVVLSPDHAVLVDGLLVPIRLLVNGATIRTEPTDRITYYHIELDSHDLLLAHGLPVESYLDTGNRGLFDNGDAPLTLHPDPGGGDARGRRSLLSCAPLVTDARVEGVWRRLAARARRLGHALGRPPTTADPDLRLSIDGRERRPVVIEGGRHVFVLPRSFGSVRLVSRSTVPSHLSPWIDDQRRLGAMVLGLSIREAGGPADIAIDHPALSDGWWGVETDGARRWRWTRGNAALPLPRGSTMLDVTIERGIAYCLEAVATAATAAASDAA